MDMIGVLIMAFGIIGIVIVSIVYFFIRLVKLFTCRDVEECRNRKCIVNGICSKYNSQLTEEEANELYKLIDDRYGKK